MSRSQHPELVSNTWPMSWPRKKDGKTWFWKFSLWCQSFTLFLLPDRIPPNTRASRIFVELYSRFSLGEKIKEIIIHISDSVSELGSTSFFAIRSLSLIEVLRSEVDLAFADYRYLLPSRAKDLTATLEFWFMGSANTPNTGITVFGKVCLKSHFCPRRNKFRRGL